MVIDAHQHFWKYDPVRDAWITDEMEILQRDYLPVNLHPLLKDNQIDGSVLVQSESTEKGNDFMLQLAESADFIKAVVGWVDLRSPEIDERLDYYSRFPVIKGFRHILQDESDRALMLEPAFCRGLQSLERYHFTYDILIYSDQLKYVSTLLNKVPEQKFVLDHLAKPCIKDGEIDDWSQEIRLLASFPNLYCKVSGMFTENVWHGWREEDFYPYLDVITETFGTKRLMYGSDWPVSTLAVSYQDQFSVLKRYFSRFSEDEQCDIFGNNAVRFYGIN